ncbi:MAG TPA: 50S ribosomal protein L40e [Candidatus Nanoarchaeia archaeon]|nr:50S ribosomal protein L40e [Candidatus Nanoarchaeia archaeon]
MAKFPEAEARLIKGKFVCRKCKSTIRSTNMMVIEGLVKCRKCKSRALRPVRKK